MRLDDGARARDARARDLAPARDIFRAVHGARAPRALHETKNRLGGHTMATSAAQLNGGGRGNTAGPVLSLRPFMFAEALSPVISGLSDEQRCAPCLKPERVIQVASSLTSPCRCL